MFNLMECNSVVVMVSIGVARYAIYICTSVIYHPGIISFSVLQMFMLQVDLLI